MAKKLLFLSSTNLTTNPRLLKELRYAESLGYKCDFIGFDLENWSQDIDNEIIKNINSDLKYIKITRNHKKNWIISTIIEKVSQKLLFIFINSLKLNSYAHSKRSFLLLKELKNNKQKYDLIIAHTLPTLYPAYKFSRRTNTPFSFDVEDYHPGETCSKQEKRRCEFLMKNLLPKASYVTYASPLIGEKVVELCSNKIKNHRLINNCFSEAEFTHKDNNSPKIKFVWFSQNIAHGRGLELILPALMPLKARVELHLIGNLYADFERDTLSKYSAIINLHKPLPQKELNLKLSEFDIGLAIEPAKDLNNTIAVSNKIWAYLQSGVYILATDTPAQTQFMKAHLNCGLVASHDAKSMETAVNEIINNIKIIRQQKIHRYNYAKKYSWEKTLIPHF